jgi:hypothetical protein
LITTFPDLSELEKTFACRALFDQCAERLAAGGRPMLPYLMEWMRGRGSTAMPVTITTVLSTHNWGCV